VHSPAACCELELEWRAKSPQLTLREHPPEMASYPRFLMTTRALAPGILGSSPQWRPTLAASVVGQDMPPVRGLDSSPSSRKRTL
jgi:hypothetical protein